MHTKHCYSHHAHTQHPFVQFTSVTVDMSAADEAIVVILSVRHTTREVQVEDKSDAVKNPTLLAIKVLRDSDTSMVHTSSPISDLKKFHLRGSRLFNLHNLSNDQND